MNIHCCLILHLKIMVRINLKSKLEENAFTQVSIRTKWFLIGQIFLNLFRCKNETVIVAQILSPGSRFLEI